MTSAPLSVAGSAATGQSWRRIDPAILAMMHELTGLESTYVTEVESDHGPGTAQVIRQVDNRGSLDLPEELTISWQDSVCRRALEAGTWSTDDVERDLPGSVAAQELGIRSYVGVPILDQQKAVVGTLCGIGRNSATVPPSARPALMVLARLVGDQWDTAQRHADRVAQAATAASRLREHSWRVRDAGHRLIDRLGVVAAGVEQLLDDPEPTEAFRDDLLAEVLTAARAATFEVEELLDAGRVDPLTRTLASEAVDLLPIVRRAADELATAGRQVRTQLTAGLAVHADPDALRQVLWHLTDNLLRYTPTDSAAGFDLGRDPTAPWARISIADRGSGIPDDIDIFAPFVRGPAPPGGSPTGAGLGLHIVRRLVTAMGGTVAAHPRAGGGSRFTIALPLDEPSAP